MPRGKAKLNGDGAAAEANGVGGNKMEAVRRALNAQGPNAKPTALHDYILTTFHLDIQPNMISSYKSTILKGGGGKGKKRGRKPKSETAAAITTGGVSMKDLKVVKELATRLGGGRLRELLDLLA